ncbi:MAG: hypothetical protein ACOY0T_25370 [Myxococcota bacterium]
MRHPLNIASLLARAALVTSSVFLVVAGCSSGTKAPCDEAHCPMGERCVQDDCRPTCTTQDDCPVGQNCAGYRFGDGQEGLYCVVLDYARNGRTGQREACQSEAECDSLRGFKCIDSKCQKRTGQFEACEGDQQCDSANGFQCVGGECRVGCSSHFDCAPVGTCESLSEGNFCKVTMPAKAGQYYQRCPFGETDCDTANGFTCVGTGTADLEAYCTAECKTEEDCPAGYRCGTIGATPCVTQCGLTGQQVPDCVRAADIGPGKRFECTEPFGLVRHVCVRNTFCAACESDEDCFGIAGQICAKDKGGQKSCTFACDPGVLSCPWGDATECGVWDKERGIATCAHRFGACRGTGKGCEPCVDSADCAPTGYCTRSGFTGERFCVDLSVSCNCADDADANGQCEGHGCPLSPGGLPMICADSDLGKHCFGANSSESAADSLQTGCWSSR